MSKSFLLCALLVAACGKSSGGGAPSAAASSSGSAVAPAAADGPQNVCHVKVSGGLTTDFTASAPRGVPGAGGKVMAGTDYWMTDDELRRALEIMVGLSKKSDDEIAAEVDKDMKNDPRLMLLLINCGDDHGHLNIVPGNGSKYADVPFGPKTYKVVATNQGKPGDFGALVGFTSPDGKHEAYSVTGSGTLDLKKFDKTGIAGTFHLTAEKMMKGGDPITIDGDFDYGCSGGSVCAK